METPVAFYQQCIKQLLSTYESLKTDEAQIEVIVDDEHLRYLAMWVGWQQSKRIHQCAIHIDICQETIIIQRNDTEERLDQELMACGIAQDKIRIGFLPPSVQDAFQTLPQERVA